MSRSRRFDPSERAASDRIVLDSVFVARLEKFAACSARLRGREESGVGRVAGGGGDEFVGHRPLRVGEDLRDFDWELCARLERPYVKVRRRDQGERWCVLLDCSASMGLGSRGKLQFAGELATALAFVGLDAGASTTLFARTAHGGIGTVRMRQRADLRPWIAFLESLRATLEFGVASVLPDPRIAAAQRVIAIGDLMDVEPHQLLALARRGRRVDALRVLAPHELAPELDEGVEWVDPEQGGRLALAVGPAELERYSRALETRLERWRATFLRRAQRCWTWSSERAFEDAARAVLA